MPANRTLDNLAEGIRGNNAALVDIFRAANERVYRMNRILIDEVERTQEERIGLFQQWLSQPSDFGGLNGAVLDTWNRRLRRRMEIARTMVDDLRDTAAGTRSIWERMTDASRQTAQASTRAGRMVAARAASEASDVADEVADTADRTARSLRRAARESNNSGLN
jgi:hypothetical protein